MSEKRYISIDNYRSHHDSAPVLTIYRSWRGGELGSSRRYRFPTKASLSRINDWIGRHGAKVSIWTTALGWCAELHTEEATE